VRHPEERRRRRRRRHGAALPKQPKSCVLCSASTQLGTRGRRFVKAEGVA